MNIASRMEEVRNGTKRKKNTNLFAPGSQNLMQFFQHNFMSNFCILWEELLGFFLIKASGKYRKL